MASNPVNEYNLNTFLEIYFKKYETSKINTFSPRERLKQKFANLKQKAKTKIGEKVEKINSIKNTSSSEDMILNSETTFKRDDYFEKLRKIYTLKKEKVNHNLKNLKRFYQKRLDEKESTKVLKTIIKLTLLTSFCFINFVYFYKMRRIRFWFLSMSMSGFLCLNIFLQYQLNARYKRRIRNFVFIEGEN